MPYTAAAIAAIGLLSGAAAQSNQAAASRYATERQVEISTRIEDREFIMFDVWQKYYLPCEKALVAKTCALPIKSPQYALAQVRATTNVRRQFSRARRESTRCIDPRCVGMTRAVNRNLLLAEMSAVTWVGAIAQRVEAERVNVLNTRRQEEIYRITAFGRQNYYQTQGSAIAAQTFGNLASIHQKAAQDAATAVGYFLQRAVSGVREINARDNPNSAIGASRPSQNMSTSTMVNNVVQTPEVKIGGDDDPFAIGGFDFGSG